MIAEPVRTPWDSLNSRLEGPAGLQLALFQERGVVDPTPSRSALLGCLIEKQRTTPDAYPLSLNSLRLAANQSTNRDPVMDLDETTVRDAVRRLGDRGWCPARERRRARARSSTGTSSTTRSR